jgi:hypothetical protein
MNEIIKLETLELELAREFLVDENNIKKLQTQIDELRNNVYDFSTAEGIKQAKELKTKANKFVKELKEFCEPLEADGKKIGDARSAITTRLSTGKNAVIEQILAPVYEREEQIKSIKSKLFIPSLNAGSNAERLAGIEALINYNWLAFEEEANKLIEQHKGFLINEKIKFDEDAKLAQEAEEKARLERENQIKLEAETKANAIAELKIKQEYERLEREKQEIEKLTKDKDHQAKIHNEILQDLEKFVGTEKAKEIIKAIAKSEIKNLKITY